MKKILAFVFDGEKFLALRNNPTNPEHGGDFWFVVTGEVEPGESHEDAVRREVKEETGLDIVDIFYLNWGSLYNLNETEYEEHNFIAFVGNGDVKLNEENVDYKWLDLDDFVSKIKWLADKSELKQVLKAGINKKLIFNKLKLDKV